MSGTPKEFRRKILCLCGGLCLAAIASPSPTIGNFGTYVESYLVHRLELPANSAWFVPSIFSSVRVLRPFVMMLAGYTERAVGTPWTSFIGALIVIIASVASFWAVNVSPVAILVTYGVLQGIGAGILTSCPFAAANKHKFDNQGLVFGILCAGNGGAGVLINLIITGFVNPSNLEPDDVHSNSRYFSQAEILDRVPYTFLLLSGIYLTLLPLGLWGMRTPPPQAEAESSCLLQDNQDRHDSITLGDESADGEETRHNIRTASQLQLTPCLLFSSKVFYLVCFIKFCTALVGVSVMSLYKTMGLTQIPADAYMAALGSMGSLCSAISRPLWGVMIDKTSLKTSIVMKTGIICILTAFWHVVLQNGRALYFVWTVLIFSTAAFGGLFVKVATKTYFGSSHFMANLGVVHMAESAEALLLPVLVSVSVDHVGWAGYSLVLSFLSFAGLLACLLLPDVST